jgi:hypothetical protein
MKNLENLGFGGLWGRFRGVIEFNWAVAALFN